MSAIQDQYNNDENGSIVMNKAMKNRRLPFSPRQGNVRVLSSNKSANVSFEMNRAPARMFHDSS